MEQKILRRLEELTNEINALASNREHLLQQLRMLDIDMEVKSALIYELKSLVETSSEGHEVDQG